jgi:hypothetical protein
MDLHGLVASVLTRGGAQVTTDSVVGATA